MTSAALLLVALDDVVRMNVDEGVGDVVDGFEVFHP